MEQLPKDRDIEAIVPMYGERGDCTCIYLWDGGKIVLEVKQRAVMRALAHRQCKEVSLLRAWSAACTQQKLAVPLPVSSELVLAPYKARRPRIAGDETLGCVNVAKRVAMHVAKDKSPKKDRQVRLQLSSGRQLPVLWSRKTMYRHLQAAHLVQSLLVRELEEALLYHLQDK
jgi:hypothetical protein